MDQSSPLQPQNAAQVRPVNPKRSLRQLWWMVGGFVVLCVGFVSGFVAGKTLYAPKSTLSPAPIAYSSPFPTPDPTTGWKTFLNGNYKYEFKYPQDWPDIPLIASNQKDGFQFAGQTVYASRNFPKVQPPQLQIEVFKSERELSSDELEEKESCGSPVFTISKRTVGGVPAIIGKRLASRDPGAPYYTGLHYCVRAYQSGFIYSLLWEEGSDKDSGVFDKILGTFRFLDTVVPSSVPNVKNIKVLKYNLQSDWKTVQDKTGALEVGYDPSISKVSEPAVENSISIYKTNRILGSFMTVRLLPYDGGSRHEFLYVQIGEKPVKEDLLPSYHEQEYTYTGRSCLFLIGITISQFPTTWGMCDAGGGKAFLITSYDDGDFEKTAQTIRLL